MKHRGQSAIEVLAGAIVLVTFMAAVSVLSTERNAQSREALTSQSEYAYCQNLAERMDFGLANRVRQTTVVAEYDTLFSKHAVLVGPYRCEYRGKLEIVDCPAELNNEISFSAGQAFLIEYNPGQCNPTQSFQLRIPQAQSSCGNGVLESGETCETGFGCQSNYNCNNCVCVPNGGGGGGGCFVAGTPVATPSGEVAIEKLVRGQELYAFEGTGLTTAKVTGMDEVRRDHYYVLRAGKSEIRVTAEHPIYIGDNLFRQVQYMKAGDTVFFMQDNKMVPQTVDSIERVNEPVVAYNLHVTEPHTFVAGAWGVHNVTQGFGVGSKGVVGEVGSTQGGYDYT